MAYLYQYCVLYICNFYALAVSIQKRFIAKVQNESCCNRFNRSRGKFVEEKRKIPLNLLVRNV